MLKFGNSTGGTSSHHSIQITTAIPFRWATAEDENGEETKRDTTNHSESVEDIARHTSSKYAFATLVMKGDGYIPGALVLGSSLRQTQTRADLVCIVTEDVSRKARKALSQIYNEVVQVQYLEFKCKPMQTAKQAERYSSWINCSFTKWRIFNVNRLTGKNYEKVCLMDSDMVVLTNIDDLFSLPTPAATFSMPWAEPWATQNKRQGGCDGIVNPYGTGWHTKHGDKISHEKVSRALNRQEQEATSFVAWSSTIVLRPDPTQLDLLSDMVSTQSAKEEGYGWRCHNGQDEQSVAELYTRQKVDWSYLHQQYNFIPWRHNWMDCKTTPPKVLHYSGKNPWEQERGEWPDLEIWWQFALQLCENNQCCEFFDAKEIEKAVSPACWWCQEVLRDKRLAKTHLFNREGRIECKHYLKATLARS